MTHDTVDILVVDDVPQNLVAIEAILSAEDYRIVRAGSGAAALLAILEHDFAAILIDVVMPGMNGFEVVDLVKRRDRSRHTPILFLSAEGEKLDFVYRAYSVGGVDYLSKPLDPAVLRAKVAIFADLFRKDRRIREQEAALRLAEQRLYEQRYRNLAEAIPQIVWTAGPDGTVTYLNRRWYEYTGFVQGSDAPLWSSAIASEDVGAVTTSWRAGLASGQTFETECRLLRHDGALRWHLCRAVPEHDEDGAIVAWLGTFTDCDDLKLAVQARDEFLSIASHELRTPLTTLQLQLDSLARDLDSTSRSRKLEVCVRQGRRLVALVDRLFDFSRITRGTLTLQREPFDLAQAARDVVERLTDIAARAGVMVHVDSAAAVTGHWDRLRVEQVIENLVSNALKYAPDRPITVAVQAGAGIARLTVTDGGPGITPDELPRIFGPFHRSSATASYAGLGLGLYIAREIAHAHGGRLEAASRAGEGTTFTLELPRMDASSA